MAEIKCYGCPSVHYMTDTVDDGEESHTITKYKYCGSAKGREIQTDIYSEAPTWCPLRDSLVRR